VDKFPVGGFNGRVIGLSLLLILTGLVLSTSTLCRAANLSERYQFDSKIELATPLPSEMKVEDVKIQNVLNISYICVNDEDFDVQKTISQGQIAWEPKNLTIQSASIIDSLGETFPFINYSGIITNPELSGIIPAHANYTLSLIVVMIPGASYVSQFQAWQFAVSTNTSLPVQASVTFPSDFSIPFFAVGAEFTKDQGHKIYTWDNSPSQEMLNISVVFLPFPYNPETKSLKFFWDIPSIFPVPTNIKVTMTHEFVSLSQYNGLNVPQIFSVPVLFPASGKDIRVLSVFDADGQYSKLYYPLLEPSNADYGTYYPDYDNSIVVVYPRSRSHGNHYYYDVSVTFDFGNEIPANVTFGFLMPYDASTVFTLVNIEPAGDWKLNMTQDAILEFLLPHETRPYPNSDYASDINGDGRYIVKFLLNTSLEVTSGIWKIDFYISGLFAFFWTEVAAILIYSLAIFGVVVFRKRHSRNPIGKMTSYVIPSLSLSGFIGAEYLIVGDLFWNIIFQRPVFTALLIIQVVLYVMVIVAQKWRFKQQTTDETWRLYVV
jgi:hypothetical protein